MDNKITYTHKNLYDLLSDKTPPNTPTYDISIYDLQAFPIPPGVEMELVGISKQELIELRERLKKTQELELEVRRENAELRELLKLAKVSVDYHCALCREYTDGQILLSKINQALGEGKTKIAGNCIEDNTPHLESTVLFKDLENQNDRNNE